MPIKTVLYVSKGAGARSRTHVRLFVPKARTANHRADVTGALLYDGRNYAGLLEGPTKSIDALMARIALDERHSRMRVLFERRRRERSYVGVPLSYTYEEKHRLTTTALIDGGRMPAKQMLEVFGMNISLDADPPP